MGETFTRVPNWVLDSPEFTAQEKLVFVALCRFQDTQGGCYPSIQRLSEVSKVGRTSIFKALDGLESKRAITRDERNRNGQRTSNYYTVHQAQAVAVRHADGVEVAVRHADGGEFATRTVAVRHANGNYIQEQEPKREQKTNTKDSPGGSFTQSMEISARERKITPRKDLEIWIKNMTEGEQNHDGG